MIFRSMFLRFVPRCVGRNQCFSTNSSLVVTNNFTNFRQLPISLPQQSHKTFLKIFDELTLHNNINLPTLNSGITLSLPNFNRSHSIVEETDSNLEISAPSRVGLQKEVFHCAHLGVLKIRKKKMNKHKFKKRRKRDRAKRRKILYFRNRNKNLARAKRRLELVEKIKQIQENNPKSTYHLRPYVVHRLTKW